MRKHIMVAIFVSVGIIGAAFFSRLSTHKPALNLVVLPSSSRTEVDPATIIPLFTGTSTTSAATITQTDMVSRQLVSDYLNLNAAGGSTLSNLTTLGSKYGDALAANPTVVSYDVSQTRVVADTPANILSYALTVFALRAKYETLSTQLLNGDTNIDTSDPRFKTLMLGLSHLFEEALPEFLNTPVPTSLAANHVALLNNYSSSAQATRIIANINEDPASVIAAFSIQANNSAEQEELFGNIRVAVIAQGLDASHL
jgi:hypothetical protein